MIGRLTRWHLRWMASARGMLATVGLVSASVALAALLALHDLAQEGLAATAVVWIVATVGGVSAGARVVEAEHAQGGLSGVLVAPVDWRDVFLSRAASLALVVAGIALGAWGACLVLFPGVSGLRDVWVVAPLAGGVVGLAPLGAFTGWVALSAGRGELLGAALGVPLAAPLLVSGIHAMHEIVEGAAWTPSLTFLVGYALSVAALCYVVSGPVVEVPA